MTDSIAAPVSYAPPTTLMPALSESDRRVYAPTMLGSDPKLMRVFDIVERVADTDCSVLVTGENGTGKELIARALHVASTRKERPCVTVNCAAIPENLLESELFGHVRGSFTGATSNRIGKFTAADCGSIFFDEIGEMPLSLQAKLLRVLQDKEVTPVGETKSQRVDVRIIAATNRDLDAMVEEGKFREDLLYRLNVIQVELPPLRERQSDIPMLIEFFVRRANERRNRNVRGMTEKCLHALCAYDWPGNVRQLENTVERMVILSTKEELDIDDVPAKVRSLQNRAGATATGSMDEPVLPDDGLDLKDTVERFENSLILQALERTGWNKNRAAAMLRMNRTTLVEKIKKKNFDQQVAV